MTRTLKTRISLWLLSALSEAETDVNSNDLIEVDPEKMSGTPCFTGTRVPVTHLFDYLEAGDTLDDFLQDFSSVTRDQALGVLKLMKKRILTDYETAA